MLRRRVRPRQPMSESPYRRYHVQTFGCQMNVHDSERMKGLLESLGLGEAADPADADLLVFNTCTIRERADDRFVAHLMEARAAKNRDPDKRSEEHTSELQSRGHLVCRLL